MTKQDIVDRCKEEFLQSYDENPSVRKRMEAWLDMPRSGEDLYFILFLSRVFRYDPEIDRRLRQVYAKDYAPADEFCEPDYQAWIRTEEALPEILKIKEERDNMAKNAKNNNDWDEVLEKEEWDNMAKNVKNNNDWDDWDGLEPCAPPEDEPPFGVTEADLLLEKCAWVFENEKIHNLALTCIKTIDKIADIYKESNLIISKEHDVLNLLMAYIRNAKRNNDIRSDIKAEVFGDYKSVIQV